MKRVLKIINKYIILVTPLLLFSLLIMSFMLITKLKGIFSVLLLLVMFVAFISGWFNMIKTAIAKENSQENQNFLWKDFLQGVGEYFLSILGASCIAFLIGTSFFIIGYLIGDLTIGMQNIPLNELKDVIGRPEALEMFLKGLSYEQIKNLFIWYIWSLFIGFLFYLSLVLYLPTIFYVEKNPFKAFLISLNKLFSKNFFKTFILLINIIAINIIISILVPLSTINIFVNGLMILLKFYIMTGFFVAIFCYYLDNFVDKVIGKGIDFLI